MDLIALMAASFLNLAVGCDALKADVMKISGQDFLVQSWSCPDKHGAPHHWRTWQRECRANNGATFWGRPYFLEDQNSGIAYYNNRFGELQGGMGGLDRAGLCTALRIVMCRTIVAPVPSLFVPGTALFLLDL